MAAFLINNRLGIVGAYQGLPNSSIELNINNDNELSNSDVYQAYKDYVQNEIAFDRKHFRSIYDNS